MKRREEEIPRYFLVCGWAGKGWTGMCGETGTTRITHKEPGLQLSCSNPLFPVEIWSRGISGVMGWHGIPVLRNTWVSLCWGRVSQTPVTSLAYATYQASKYTYGWITLACTPPRKVSQLVKRRVESGVMLSLCACICGGRRSEETERSTWGQDGY